MPHNPQHFVPILTRDEQKARRLAREIKEQPNVFERIGRLPFPGGGTFEQAAGGLGRIVEAVSAPFSLAGAITGAVTSGKPNEAREIDELFGQMVRGKITPLAFTSRLIEKQRAKPPGEQLVTELPAMFFQPVKAVKEATGAFKGAVKAAETVTGVPLRPSMRQAVAARPAGAAVRQARDPGLREIDEELARVERAIKAAESVEGTKEAQVALDDTRAAILATRSNILENLMGEEKYAEYVAVQRELEEARQMVAVGTGGAKAPFFGSPERVEYDALRRARAEAGRPHIPTAQVRKRMAQKVRALREAIEVFEDEAYKSITPAAKETQVGGVLQRGMGLGEKPPQGGLFENLRGEGERIPLADAEQMALRQARAAEVARGQAEMLPTPPRVPEAPVAPPERGAVLAALSDEELKARRIALPKYKNDMTPEQIAESESIYTEQAKRFKGSVETYNREATEATGLKKGDRVSTFAQGIFGLGGEKYTGTVVLDRNGRLAVKLDMAEGSGRKIIPISKAFRKEGEVAPPPRPVPPVAPAAAKEPWEMTQAEAVASNLADTPSSLQGRAREAHIEGVRNYHKGQVLRALSEGKPVPASVLKDYPDLVARAPVIEAITPKRARVTVRKEALEAPPNVPPRVPPVQPVIVSPEQKALDAALKRVLRRPPVSQEPRAPSPPSASQPRVPPQAAEARPSLVEAEAPLERGGRTPQGPPPKTPIAEGAPPIPPEEPVSKLLGLIKAAKPVRAETEALKHEDLRRRAAILASAQERATGEAAVLRARGVLKGELPKAEFDPPAAGLSQAERDTLFDAINESSLRPFERLPVEDGLVKALNGQVPTIGEIEGLERVFGKDLSRALLSKRPWTAKALEQVLDTVNLPKAFRFGFDLSFSLRQAGPFLTVQTFRPYLRMFRDQAKALLRKDLAESLQAAREVHPKYGFAKDAGLEITEVGAARLSRREELWASGLLGKLAEFRLPTGAGKAATAPVRLVFGGAEASQRAFVEAGNNIRFGVFTQEVNRVERSGLQYSLESAKRLSRFLNWTTGRGPLGGAERTSLGPLLNAVFTAPRFVTSRFAVPALGVVETARTVGALARLQRPDPASAFIARQMSEWMARNIALLVLLDKSGLAKVEWDPRSSDWGKIVIAGKVRIDPWSGFQQAARFLANLATKQRKPLTGKGVQPVQPGDVLFQFFRSKLSPSVSAAADLWTGKDVTGQPASLLGEAAELFLPITADDILEASEELGVWPGAALAPLTVLGAGTQVFDPTERTTSRRGKRATLEDLQDALRDDELESTLDELDRSLRTKLREAVPAGR